MRIINLNLEDGLGTVSVAVDDSLDVGRLSRFMKEAMAAIIAGQNCTIATGTIEAGKYHADEAIPLRVTFPETIPGERFVRLSDGRIVFQAHKDMEAYGEWLAKKDKAAPTPPEVEPVGIVTRYEGVIGAVMQQKMSLKTGDRLFTRPPAPNDEWSEQERRVLIGAINFLSYNGNIRCSSEMTGYAKDLENFILNRVITTKADELRAAAEEFVDFIKAGNLDAPQMYKFIQVHNYKLLRALGKKEGE